MLEGVITGQGLDEFVRRDVIHSDVISRRSAEEMLAVASWIQACDTLWAIYSCYECSSERRSTTIIVFIIIFYDLSSS